MEINKKIYLLIGVVLILGVLLFIVVLKIISEGNKCVNSPLVYGASKIVGKEGEPLYHSCYCSGEGWGFTFDREGMYIDKLFLSNERGEIFYNESR
jgi:hypothetical protein